MAPDEERIYSQIHELVTLQAAGRLEAEQAQRLERLVLSDPTARRLYAAYVRETASLRWWAGANSSGVAEQASPRTATERGSSSMPAWARPWESAWRIVRAHPRAWSLAAAVLLATGLTIALSHQMHRPAVSHNFATLDDAARAQWEEAAPKIGMPLASGTHQLRAGDIHITFGNGAEVIVHGPAHFELGSAGEMGLQEGRLAARVGHQSLGFAVHTPSATVVDLGTEFGVRVDAAGATEVQVSRGTVEVKPAAGATATKLSAGNGAQVDRTRLGVRPVPYLAPNLTLQPSMIDLVDVIAGGDGWGSHRNAGINVATGSPVSAEPTMEERKYFSNFDRAFHPCPARPLIAGVFLPAGDDGPVVLDPAGHTFSGFPKSSRLEAFYWLWAGGTIPMDEPEYNTRGYPTTIGALDYNSPGHGLLFMHASKGVTFDLARLRASLPSASFTQFRAVCVNTSASSPRSGSERSDFWVFVDGKLQFSRSPVMRHDPPFEVAIPLQPGARYLTLAATDGGDSAALDWITLGDPRIE